VLSEIWNPILGPLYLPHFLSDPFHIFRDGRLPEGLPFPPKVPPELLLVSPNLKGKFWFGAPKPHLKLDFGVKNVWKRFLWQK